jgi:molecular chaperone DnaK
MMKDELNTLVLQAEQVQQQAAKNKDKQAFKAAKDALKGPLKAAKKALGSKDPQQVKTAKDELEAAMAQFVENE